MWEQHPDAMQVSLERHNQILQDCIAHHGGIVYKIIGDEFQSAFAIPSQALEAAISIQTALSEEKWGESGPIKVRIGIHTGPAHASQGDYDAISSHTLNRVARLMSVGHGGQIILSLAVEELVRGLLPQGVSLDNLGEHFLKGIDQPVHIFQASAPGLPHIFPSLKTRVIHHHNLPVENTPFVGREAEISNINALLSDPACRLVSVVGQGGMGKSRLAIQVARQIEANFPDGVWYVPLAPLRSPEHIPTAVGQALNLSFSGQVDPQEQLLHYLVDKEMLLLLDNYEHLLPEGASLPISIMENTPKVKILVTSRARLNLQNEWVVELQGLPYPKDEKSEEVKEFDAVTLFLAHARRVAGGSFPEQDRHCVVRLSQLVEGMPLAIVLAASWLNSLTCDLIVKEVEDNLDFLESELRDIPERHRSLQAVFDESWKLLDPEEQTIFKHLSVFRGGFNNRAAKQVTGASLRSLASLVNKSLLNRGAGGRYQMHELLRQYAWEKLQNDPEEAAQVCDLHCSYFADLLRVGYDDLFGEKQQQALLDIISELENIRTAWQWSLEQAKIPEIRIIAGSLYYFCQMQNRYLEGKEGAQTALNVLENMEPSKPRDLTMAQVLTYLGWLGIRLGEYEQAKRALEKSREINRQYDNAFSPGMGMDPDDALGILAMVQGDYTEAVRLGEASRRLSLERGDQVNLLFAYYVLENAYLALGRIDEARQSAQNAYALSEERKEKWFRAYILIDLGNIARSSGDYLTAKENYQASYNLRELFNDAEGMAVALTHLGEIAILQEDYQQAEVLYQRSVKNYQVILDRGGLADALNGLGRAAMVLGKMDEAKGHFLEALRITSEINYQTLTTNILTNLSEWFLRSKAEQKGLELASLVLDSPHADESVKVRIQQILDDFNLKLSGGSLPGSKAQGVPVDFKTTLVSLVRELESK